MSLQAWSGEPHVTRVVDLTHERALCWLLEQYGGARPKVLQAVLGHAFQLGARSVVVEYRYVDQDWRNEHKAFYTGTFRRYPSVAHRLHFFAESTPGAPGELGHAALVGWVGRARYLGYSVMRPVPAAPVGRTFLEPLRPHSTMCSSDDVVNLFGVSLTVSGIAFLAQDAQLSRCAQTTTWVTAYHHHRRFNAARALPGDIAAAVVASTEHGRPLPSPGLTIGQIADVARAVGLPPLVYPLRLLGAGQDPERVICRYLNSSLPVTVATGTHAFVLVGYGRRTAPDGSSSLYFVRHDDEVGPYQEVDRHLDQHGPWQYAVVPLPEKVYLPGENAEAIGVRRIQDALDRSTDPRAVALVERLQDPEGRLTFRSTVMRSNEYKARLTEDNGYPERVAAAFQMMQMSRYVWVVELLDRDRCESDGHEHCVLAEAVIDATDHIRDLHALGWRIPGEVRAWVPDADIEEMLAVPEDVGPTPSVAPCV